jgi:hypothetical protein
MTAAERPLFVPLRTEYFRAIEAGTKRIEWRAYGPRWNHEVVRRGRAITFSRGYSGERLHGIVTSVRRVVAERAPAIATQIYPDAREFCAIRFRLSHLRQ